jgi:hypothetical protein
VDENKKGTEVYENDVENCIACPRIGALMVMVRIQV